MQAQIYEYSDHTEMWQQVGPEETVVVVRYGELFLKSEPVKRRFIGILVDNIGRALQSNQLAHQLEYPRGRIIIHGEEPIAIAEAVARIFGVVDTALCMRTGSRPEDLARTMVRLAKARLSPGMSFAVRAKREKKEGMPSPELAAFLGSAVLREIPDIHVDLDHPEVEIHVEVREMGGLVCDRRLPAPGGLPFGTQGKFLSLLSSGIDSPVAAWMMMKRGCIPQYLFVDAEQWSGTDVCAGACENFRRLSLWCPGHTIPMTLVPAGVLYQRMVEREIPPRFRCVICKRFMYRVGTLHAREVKALALVTGENLGQVASQTLSNLATISEATTMPVLRPLITWDKKEIVDCGREIGTFPGTGGDLSCRAVPHKPSTGADLATVKDLERRMEIEVLAEECLARCREITARDGQITKPESPEIP